MTKYKKDVLSNIPTSYLKQGNNMNEKVLSLPELSALQVFVEEVLALCEYDEDLAVQLEDSAVKCQRILGIYPEDIEDDEVEFNE